MDLFSLADQGWWFAVPVGLVLGAVLGVSPLGWPAAVTALGVATGTEADRRPDRSTLLAMGLGITLIYVVLGALVGVLEDVIRSGFGAAAGPLYGLLAAVVFAAGLALILRPEATCSIRQRRPRTSRATDVALGALLASVGCPACAGIITGVALSGAAAGGAVGAAAAMAAFGVGQTLTLLLLGRIAGTWTRATTSPLLLQRVGGVTLALTGVWFTWQAFASGFAVSPTLP